MSYGLHPDTELIHEGVRVNLRVKPLPKRGGGTLRREIAEVADAVVILPLIQPGDPAAEGLNPSQLPGVVLIRNERFAVKQTLWELPAGTLEDGEDPADCAGRELEEETGYRASRIEPMTAFWASPGFTTERMHAFVATGLTQTQQSLDETERIVPEVRSWDQTMQMVKDGQMGDAKTLAALMWYAAFGFGDQRHGV